MVADTQDFPFVDSLPKREKKKLFSLWDSLAEYRVSVELHGPPLSAVAAAKLLGVTKGRIHQIKDRFQFVTAPDGTRYISANSVAEYAQKERLKGRPSLAVSTGKK